MLNRFTQIMFQTFAVPKIPKGPVMNVYSYNTLEELVNALQTAKASPDLVAALNQRVSGGIHVPRDFATLEEAAGFLKRYADSDKDPYSISLRIFKDGADAEHKANDDPDIVTIPRKIVVGKGVHKIEKGYGRLQSNLPIYSVMNIVGDPEVPRKDIVIVGGISFEEGIPGICHLQHLTLRQATGRGVDGWSSFTMDDVLVEHCGDTGVFAYGTSVDVRCTNVEVRQCAMSGVLAVNGASITLIGTKTTVHDNCTAGDIYSYGLDVHGSTTATIQLVFPLTKEQVSRFNGGGGNWGAEGGSRLDQIKTIPE